MDSLGIDHRHAFGDITLARQGKCQSGEGLLKAVVGQGLAKGVEKIFVEIRRLAGLDRFDTGHEQISGILLARLPTTERIGVMGHEKRPAIRRR